MKVLAVDLGGTHATCALVEERAVIRLQTIEIAKGAKLGESLPSLAAAFRRLVTAEKLCLESLAGVAVAFCGLVDSSQDRVIAVNGKFEDGPELDLRSWARNEFQLPLFLENDARMALLGERYAGAAIGFDDLVMVTLGTGIGGAAMVGGELLKGKHFQAGCLGGHFPVHAAGDSCTCGGFGCAESEAAGWSLPRVCRNWAGFTGSALANEVIDFESLFRCADAGDTVARQVREHCLQVWGANAVTLIHAYDPELLVYGGGVMRSGDLIVKSVQEHIWRRAWTPWGKVEVRAANLGNNAALLGAIPLIAKREKERADVR